MVLSIILCISSPSQIFHEVRSGPSEGRAAGEAVEPEVYALRGQPAASTGVQTENGGECRFSAYETSLQE